MSEKGYTVRQSVLDTLRMYDKGSNFSGLQFCRDCQSMLNAHAVHRYPMQDTFMRVLREVKGNYNIIVKNREKSLYHVLSNEEIALNEPQKTLW